MTAMVERSVTCQSCNGLGFDYSNGFYCYVCSGTGQEVVSISLREPSAVKLNGKRLALIGGLMCVAAVAVYWWMFAPLMYKVFGG